MEHHVVVEVEWCDPYLGYTVYEWLLEVRDILEKEHCSRIIVVKVPVCRGGGDPVVRVRGREIVGLPGEEGYLIEAMKKLLDDVGVRCSIGTD